MVPALVRFGGSPEVDAAGNLLYRFPSLQVRFLHLHNLRDTSLITDCARVPLSVIHSSTVVPALVRFGGSPEVDAAGNLLHRFPSLQVRP